ncbi:MAG TPA: DinB family protein [Microlunatus sp.]|nr:DinB family protein [Microlunatus sp.]
MITTYRLQLEIGGMLLDHHLSGLVAEDLFWAPAPVHWTMHETADGWAPDFAEVEPAPVPAATVAWLTWHLHWWWSATLADLRGEPAPARTDVGWRPDPEVIRANLDQLRQEWAKALAESTETDLARPSGFPWPADAGRTRADQFAWFGVEFAKNVSEIGQLMLLRRAGAATFGS